MVISQRAINFKPGLALGSEKSARHLPSVVCLLALLLRRLYISLNWHWFSFSAFFQSLP
jgi:hypothetical protein